MIRPGLDALAAWPPRRRELLIATVVVCLLTVYALVSARDAIPLDLSVYRRGGESVLEGTDRLYVTPEGLLPFTYPPLAAILFVPISLLPPFMATTLVAAVSYAALYLVVVVARRHLMARRAVPALVAAHPAVLVLVLAFVEPVTATIGFGQVNLVLAGLVVGDLLLLRGRWSGILLGVAIGIKVTPAVFLLVPLLRRDWATLQRAVVTGVLGVVVPLAVVPESGLTFWLHALWDPERVGGVAYVGNQSMEGALWRASGPGGVPALGYALSVVVIALAVYSMRHTVRGDSRDRLAAVLTAAVAGLLVSPISWSHHWVWVVPLVLWLWTQRVERSVKDAAARRSWLQQLHRLPRGLAIAWLVATFGRLVWLAPAGDGKEFASPLPVKLLADAYPLLGFATLVTVALLVRVRRSGVGASPGPETVTVEPVRALTGAQPARS